jgi:hypothetical protein
LCSVSKCLQDVAPSLPETDATAVSDTPGLDVTSTNTITESEGEEIEENDEETDEKENDETSEDEEMSVDSIESQEKDEVDELLDIMSEAKAPADEENMSTENNEPNEDKVLDDISQDLQDVLDEQKVITPESSTTPEVTREGLKRTAGIIHEQGPSVESAAPSVEVNPTGIRTAPVVQIEQGPALTNVTTTPTTPTAPTAPTALRQQPTIIYEYGPAVSKPSPTQDATSEVPESKLPPSDTVSPKVAPVEAAKARHPMTATVPVPETTSSTETSPTPGPTTERVPKVEALLPARTKTTIETTLMAPSTRSTSTPTIATSPACVRPRYRCVPVKRCRKKSTA